ncbi:unnamed protein product [Adineta steineri]|uniref:G-protein coupled receptors family 1 profile domain-containing protein n=1 Tax=Adineta steineri TaxID=433720 RepID=A0A815GJ35_9BILA|nr:unnamed protein product [Adineta steineri]CAF1339095.1 unnamed protein product [Adineta steineri]CAF1347969.1 unnamed protein product [Adineta steineri]
MSSSSSLLTQRSIIESWFIPIDIVMLVCTILVIILSTIFLCIILLDKTCHTVSMMLIGNSCLTVLVFGCVLLSMCAFTLENDLKQIIYEDSLCIIRAYFDYVAAGVVNYSFLIQALYRYVTVIYPNRLFWQSARFQFLIICLTWMIAFIFPTAFIFTGQVKYNGDNQICQVPVQPSFYIVYPACCIFVIPVSLIMLIYLKLFRYVHKMNTRITPANTLFRAQRELKMAQRIVILVSVLLTIGFPYAFFILMSFFTTPPKYHYRIAFLFVDISLALVMMALFQFTDPIKVYMIEKIKRRPNPVIQTI